MPVRLQGVCAGECNAVDGQKTSKRFTVFSGVISFTTSAVQRPPCLIDLLIELFICLILDMIETVSRKQLIFHLDCRSGGDARKPGKFQITISDSDGEPHSLKNRVMAVTAYFNTKKNLKSTAFVAATTHGIGFSLLTRGLKSVNMLLIQIKNVTLASEKALFKRGAKC